MKFKIGFTLIELLVVMAVLAVLAAGLFAVIDPLDKIAVANDTKVISDISQIANASQTYAARNGTYPVGANFSAINDELKSKGDLKADLTAPTATGYNAYAGVGTTTNLYVRGNLLSKKYRLKANGGAVCSTGVLAFYYWNTTNYRGCMVCSNSGPTAGTVTCN